MTRDSVRHLLEGWPEWTDETVLGFDLRRVGCVHNTAPVGPDRWFRGGFGGVWRTEVWRLVVGGGIAGNSDAWWLVELPDGGHRLGPYRTVRAMRDALRQWRQWNLP